MTTLPTNQIHEHKLVKGLPRWADDDERLIRLAADITEHGIIEPLKVTARGELVDGRHRWRAAKRLKLPEVPVIEVADDQVVAVILSTLSHRRHYTKGQRAYLSVPLFAPVIAEAQARRLANLKQSGGSKVPPFGLTPEEVAEQVGVSRELLDQARRLHKAFEDHPELREQFEPLILDPDGGIGLGAALAGIAGKLKTTGQTPRVDRNSHLHKFTSGLSGLSRAAAGWDKWDPEVRDFAANHVRKTVRAFPDDLLDVMAAALRSERRERNQQHAVE